MFYSCAVNGKTLLYALVIPAAICMIVVIVLFVIGIIGVLKTKCEINRFNQSQSNRRPFRYVVFGVVILVGLPWCFAFFAIGKATMLFQLLFSITMSAQGFVIFIYFVVFNSDVRRLISETHCFKKPTTTTKTRIEMRDIENKEAVVLVGEST